MPGPDHEHPSVPDDEAGWDERYASAPALWSGEPNASLVDLLDAVALTPAAALDVGCGEGGDAVWLAGRGWQVTGTDISSVALDRAAAAAEAAGVAERCRWVHADIGTTTLPAGPFDLVNAQYLHLPSPERPALWNALAATVGPGGTLLIVGHDVSDPHVAESHHLGDRFHDAGEVVAALGAGWDVGMAGAVERQANGADRPRIDMVVRARRI
jgi:SAM-dependent methyltransferase